MTNEYCGDLRRRRIRAKAAQKHIKIQAREIPWVHHGVVAAPAWAQRDPKKGESECKITLISHTCKRPFLFGSPVFGSPLLGDDEFGGGGAGVGNPARLPPPFEPRATWDGRWHVRVLDSTGNNSEAFLSNLAPERQRRGPQQRRESEKGANI